MRRHRPCPRGIDAGREFVVGSGHCFNIASIALIRASKTNWPQAKYERDQEHDGALGGIRTPDPQIRSLVLYPAELRAPRVFTKRRSAIWVKRSSFAGGPAHTSQNLCNDASALARRAGHAMTKSTQQRSDDVRSTGVHKVPRRERPASFARTQRSRAHSARGFMQPPRGAARRRHDGAGRYARRDDGAQRPSRGRWHGDDREQDKLLCRRAEGRHRARSLHATASRPHDDRAGDAHYPRRWKARGDRHANPTDLRRERRERVKAQRLASCDFAERGFQGRNSRPSPPVISVDGYQMEAAMTDPRDFDRRMDMERQAEMESRIGTTTPWGWIAGAVFIVIILALIFAGGDNTRTAREDTSPPATTGMAPRAAPPTVTVPPGQPPSTTGQRGQ